MSTKECPSCAVEINKGDQVCPVCGYEFPQRKSSLKWVALLMLILFTYPILRGVIWLFHQFF